MMKYNVIKRYEIEKENLKQQLAQLSSKVCLTSYCWIACTNIDFISLIQHYFDKNWKLKSRILSFARRQPPHTRHDLSLKILRILKRLGNKEKIFSITLDMRLSKITCKTF